MRGIGILNAGIGEARAWKEEGLKKGIAADEREGAQAAIITRTGVDGTTPSQQLVTGNSHQGHNERE